MTINIRRDLIVFGTFLLTITLLSAQQPMPQTTSEKIPGQSQVTTETLNGTVVSVDGNDLLVRMVGGDLRAFNVPASRKFLVDGKELSVRDLKPNTTLTATVTTTTTPVVERTTTIGSGKVWFVSGNTVILTLPNHENKMYKVEESYRFNVNGQPSSVHELKPGMMVSATKIVESPKTVIASNTVVTGHAPPQPQRAATPTPTVARAPAPAPAPAAAPEPAPAPAAAPAPPTEVAQVANPPAELPTTGSPVPLVGLTGLLFAGAWLALRRLRHSI